MHIDFPGAPTVFNNEKTRNNAFGIPSYADIRRTKPQNLYVSRLAFQCFL